MTHTPALRFAQLVRQALPMAATVGMLAGLVAVAPSQATEPEPLDESAACEALAALDFGDGTEITSTQLAPATGTLPESCRVALVVPAAINIQVWMPTGGEWNGRYQGVGNGGFAGSISTGAMTTALRDRFATASTDTGNQGGFPIGSWAIGRPDLIEDFGYRAINEMTVKAKTIIVEFYGTEPDYSYFTGCSTGGRQGMMQMQRYPDSYDGILSGAPAIDMTGFQGAQIWAAQATSMEPDGFIPPCMLEHINDAVLEQCGDLINRIDGVLDDPRRCDFDPNTLIGRDFGPCGTVTAAQVRSLERLYEGPRNSAGEQVYPGFAMGSEYGWSGRIGPSPHFAGTATYASLVHQDLDWDWTTFDLDVDIPLARDLIGDIMDATDPDLSEFKAHGGKFIMWHGWNDLGIRAERSIMYYQSVVDAMGGLRKTTDFARLFVMPGVDHCGGGPGPDSFDGLAALMAWVEDGMPPDEIVATQVSGGVVERTRPLCPYPNVARWTGEASRDDAANFVCDLKGLDRADEINDFDRGQQGRNEARRASGQLN